MAPHDIAELLSETLDGGGNFIGQQVASFCTYSFSTTMTVTSEVALMRPSAAVPNHTIEESRSAKHFRLAATKSLSVATVTSERNDRASRDFAAAEIGEHFRRLPESEGLRRRADALCA